VAVTQHGVKTRLIFAWNPLGFSVLSTVVNSIKYRRDRGFLGDVGVGELGELGRVPVGYRIRDGPVTG
jgi:hypothetical protein